MKLKIGDKLTAIRDERRLSQAEFAELLGVSASTYQRMEKNESYADIDQIMRFSKVLDVPVQDFLPDTFTLHNHNTNGQGGIVLGNYSNYNYIGENEKFRAMENEILLLKEKLAAKERECALLAEQNSLLKKLIEK